MTGRRRVAILTLILLFAADARAASQEQGISAIKTGDGILLVWNQPNDFFTLEVKGTDIRPLGSERVFFEVDGVVFQVQSAAVSQFLKSGTEGRSAQSVLDAHRDWEAAHIEGLLGKKLKVASSPLKLKGGGEALLWKFDMPEGLNGEAKQQMFVTVLNGENVLLLNGVVSEKVREAAVEQFLVATAGTLKRSPKPIDLRELQEAIRKGKPQ